MTRAGKSSRCSVARDRAAEPQGAYSRLPRSDLAELHGHLELAIAERAGADDLAVVRRRSRPAADLDRAGLSDGQALLQQEGDAAERQVAGQDLVLGVGGRPVEDGEDRTALERLAAVVAALGR